MCDKKNGESKLKNLRHCLNIILRHCLSIILFEGRL